jgi:ABC-2 type transport system permease protein
MSTQSNAVPESSFQSQGIAPAAVSPFQTMYWSIRRELWENHSIYIAPLIAAALLLLGHFISMVPLQHRGRAASASHYEFAAFLIMGTALIVGVFYSLDALYGERRDRSILFWKSLPVSDLITVLSKLTIPFIILPLLSFVIAIATQFIMLLLGSAMLLGSGANPATLWTGLPFVHVSLVVLYHIVTVHGLWYAPLYGWLLLVSAWAPRAPFLWAVLPPFVICGLEKVAFGTSYCLGILQNRLTGPQGPQSTAAGGAHTGMDFMATLIPQHFFSEPGLWIGLAVAAAFVAGAVRLRRCKGPI